MKKTMFMNTHTCSCSSCISDLHLASILLSAALSKGEKKMQQKDEEFFSDLFAFLLPFSLHIQNLMS